MTHPLDREYFAKLDKQEKYNDDLDNYFYEMVDIISDSLAEHIEFTVINYGINHENEDFERVLIEELQKRLTIRER